MGFGNVGETFNSIYARNAIGESLAYAFLPLIFIGCYQHMAQKIRMELSH